MIDLELSQVQVSEIDKNHAVLTISPLPPGYGTTLGTALRRVLLSSLDGAAITGIKIPGVSHEFSTIKGVKDSIVDIILNLKQIKFKSHSDEPVTVKISAGKTGAIYAKDIQVTSDVEVVTPDQYITSIEDKVKFEVEIIVEKGIGYSAVLQREKKKTKDPSVIQIDAFFSPIRRVRFSVTDTRVGQDTNLDKLEMEVLTDGSITPQDALAKAAGLLRNYFSLLDPKCLTTDKTAEYILETKRMKSDDEGVQKRRKYTPVEVLKLSPRTLNALVNNDVTSVEQLVSLTSSKLANLKGFGARAMTEVKDALHNHGLLLADEVSSEDNNA